jgi:ABC-type lipoprotein export system ATPase subunit
MITLQHVYKNYGAIRVLEGLDIEINEGTAVCLLGRSGCGKSTLLKLIALITRPDEGTLNFEGRNVSSMTQSQVDALRKQEVAYSFQEPLLIPYISAIENITAITGSPKDEAARVLSELGLSERMNHRPSKLSGGERKRVDLARAILRETKVLVADEPLSNLDPQTGEKVMQLLKARTKGNGIFVYSSVEPNGSRYADQVLNMEEM